MLYYLKKGFFSFLYLFFMMTISISINLIENLVWLKIILHLINAGLYFFIVGAVSYKDGQEALKIRISNDSLRREIIRTGEDKPLKLKEEYKPFKGAIIGTCVCIPLFLFLLIHLILILAGSETKTFGALASYIYSVTFAFFRMTGEEISMGEYFYSLIFAGVLIPLYSVCYILGGKKAERRQEEIAIFKGDKK